ncbi:MAG: hypothetical protein R3F02_18605 [Thiolinea sp.]
MSQSNSGGGACGVTASGVRRQGVDVVVDIVRKNPGLDSFCIAWTYAGGRIENGQLVGTCRPLPPNEFAVAVSLQKRVLDAKKLNRIEVCQSRAVVRKRDDGSVIRAEAYKLPGHIPTGVGMSRPDRLPPPSKPRVEPVVPVDPDVAKVAVGDFESLQGLLD